MKHNKYTIISDLHLGDHSKADDFHTSGSGPLLDHLIREIQEDPKHHLVLLGDLFELWQFTLDEIFTYNAKQLNAILALAAEGRLTYVIGNHDYEPFNIYLPIGRVFGNVPMLETFEIPEIGLCAVHGHMQDPNVQFMVPLPGQEGDVKLSREFVFYLKYIENRYANVEDRIGAIKKLAKRGWDSARNVLDVLDSLNSEKVRTYYEDMESSLLEYIPPSENLHDSEDPWEQAAFEMIDKSSGRYRTVLMGHTHVPRWVSSDGKTYINTGSWCYTQRFPCSFARVDMERKTATLWRIEGKNGDFRTSEWKELLNRKDSGAKKIMTAIGLL